MTYYYLLLIGISFVGLFWILTFSVPKFFGYLWTIFFPSRYRIKKRY